MQLKFQDGFSAVDENGIRWTVKREGAAWRIYWQPTFPVLRPLLAVRVPCEGVA